MSNLSSLRSFLDAEFSGTNLEYDPDFLQLEQEVRGTPEIEYGVNLTKATSANWSLVMTLASSLMQRSQDLRVAIHIVRAQLNLQGWAGLSEGLALIEALLVNRWSDFHPQLDPGDGYDPLQRINILSALCEPAGLLRELREAPLVNSPALGPFSLRDIYIANGELVALPVPERATLALIEAAFQEADQAQLRVTAAVLAQAVEHCTRIEHQLTENVGITHALSLTPLSSMLQDAADFIRPRLIETQGVKPWPMAQAASSSEALPPPFLHTISSRDDVKKVLGQLCAYYVLHEPASPVPLLLSRARDLVDKNFTELVRDLAADGLTQLLLVSGSSVGDA